MCGEELSADATSCEKCGHVIEKGFDHFNDVSYVKPHKSKGVATVLSVIFMGLEQIHVGRIVRGIILAVIEMFASAKNLHSVLLSFTEI